MLRDGPTDHTQLIYLSNPFIFCDITCIFLKLNIELHTVSNN